MGTQRVSLVLFDYTYTMTFYNSSSLALENVYIEMIDVPSNITIVDPDVTF